MGITSGDATIPEGRVRKLLLLTLRTSRTVVKIELNICLCFNNKLTIWVLGVFLTFLVLFHFRIWYYWAPLNPLYFATQIAFALACNGLREDTFLNTAQLNWILC